MKTRQAVFDAMAELLKTEEFENITVGEILNLSKVSRSTFYAHFAKKEDVIRELCDELFHHVLSPDLKKETGHDFSSYSIFDFKHLLTHLLFHIQEDRELIKGINKGSAGTMLHHVLRERLSPLMLAGVNSRAFYRDGIRSDLQQKLFTESFLVILDDWIMHDCEESPYLIAEVFYRFSNETQIQ